MSLRRDSLIQHGIVGGATEEAEERLLHVSVGRVFPSTWNIAESVNLRDLATAGGELVLAGRVYRSSQVVSTSQLKELAIKTVIDLRQAPVACKADTHNLRQALWALITDCFNCGRQPVGDDEQRGGVVAPNPCWKCTEACDGRYGCDATVYHVDLLPKMVQIRIFAELPGWMQRKVLGIALQKQNAEPVVAAAVADPSIMGYLKLYKIILDHAQPQVIKSLQLYADPTNYPILVHCIHGKDRTGLIVMLLYHICDVPEEIIIKDYAHSESLLREGRENRKLLGIEEHMTTDEIISAAEAVMIATIAYLKNQYGGVLEYLRIAGMTNRELEAIRRNLTGLRNLNKAELDKRLNIVHTS